MMVVDDDDDDGLIIVDSYIIDGYCNWWAIDGRLIAKYCY